MRRARRSDAGFTLTEIIVTMMVISMVLLGLITVQLVALKTVSLSKQRQQATALANRTMEQLRALPYDTVTAGLNSADLSGDPNITSSGGVPLFTPEYDTGISEPLQTSSGQTQAPLYPHVQDASTAGTPTVIGGVDYQVRTYVSRVDPVADVGYHLTVLVGWTSGVTGSAGRFVAVRSQVYSPTGCTASSTATRPFAGPCQAFFYADAGASPAGITVTPLTAGSPLISGIDATAAEAKLPTLSARTQNEQIVSAQSTGVTSAGAVDTGTGTTTLGGGSGASAADTDPATGTGTAPAAASPFALSGSSSASGTGTEGWIGVTVPDAPGSVYSTAIASNSPACEDADGTALVTGQACSSGQVTPGGSYAAQLNLNLSAAGRALGTTTLASIGPAGSGQAWRAYGARLVSAASGHCALTSGIGCVTAGARRDLGAVSVGQVPGTIGSDVLPVGFTGMVTLSGMAATVESESGIDPSTATATRTGTLSYWDGSGYSVLDLSTADAGAELTLGSADATYVNGSHTYLRIHLSGSVRVDPVSVIGANTGTCQDEACTQTVTAGKVYVQVQYELTDGSGNALGSFVVATDLGSATAVTTYKAAPSA